MEPEGLKIRNITQRDDGEYTCRAEVKDEGRYDEKRITVTVHSQSPSSCCSYYSSASSNYSRFTRRLFADEK